MNHSEITSFIWRVADLIRNTFKRGKYQDVILPLTVLRRIESHSDFTRRCYLAVPDRTYPTPQRAVGCRILASRRRLPVRTQVRAGPVPAHAGGVGAA